MKDWLNDGGQYHLGDQVSSWDGEAFVDHRRTRGTSIWLQHYHLDNQDLSEITSIFEASDNVLEM